MKMHRGDGERILAVFIDFENVGLSFGGRRDRFSIEKVLERLVEKGKIVAKTAYADWSRFGGYAASLHASAVELIEIPKRNQTGKNSADIRMCVDAMDLAYSKDHIDTFVIVSGDSDFSPLVSKLKELGKHVIGLGLSDSTSELLRDNCDEFLYYEDLDRVPNIPLAEDNAIPEPKRKVFELLLDSLLALRRENKEVIYSSMAKDTMKRKKPSFNEEYHGYRTFSELLEDAQRYGLLELEKSKNSGTYVITRFGSEPRSNSGVQPVPPRVVTLPPPSKALPPKVVALPPAQASPPAQQPPRKPDTRPTRTEAPARPESRPSRSDSPRPQQTTPIRSGNLPAPPAPTVRGNGANDRVFGRDLIEDAFDDLLGDEIPSYGIPKKKPVPNEAPPVEKVKPTVKNAEPAKKPEAAKPAPREKAPVSPPSTPAKATGERKPANRSVQAPVRNREPEREPPKTAPRTRPSAPVPDEDDSFGAGLD